MRVSVLIPTCNRSGMLREAIESVLNQTCQDFEVIVVDDGSADDTPQVARSFARVKYVRQPHSGISAARNRALEEARGELIAWLDDDDLYAPEKLERQVAFLDSHPECEIVFCKMHHFATCSEGGMSFRERRMLASDDVPYENCLAGACIRRELYARCGGYSLNRPHMEDSDWLARAAVGGVDLSNCLPERLYLRRVHAGQVTFSHPPVSRGENLVMLADAIRAARRRAPC